MKVYKTVYDRAVTGNYLVHGDAANADVAAVYLPTFGRRDYGGRYEPGPSNLALAKYVVSKFQGVPVFAQWEAWSALWNHGCKPAATLGNFGQKMNTNDAAHIAVDLMDEAGLLKSGAKIAVAAHGHYVPRADANLQSKLPAGVETVVLPGLEIPWDTKSADWWTQSENEWCHKEPYAIAYFAIRGLLDLRHEVQAMLDIAA